VKLVTNVSNEKNEKADIKISTKLLDANNNIVGESEVPSSVNANDKGQVIQHITVNSPKLWSPDAPYLYKAEITLSANGTTQDVTTTNFGIRTIKFSAENGFTLNGKK